MTELKFERVLDTSVDAEPGYKFYNYVCGEYTIKRGCDWDSWDIFKGDKYEFNTKRLDTAKDIVKNRISRDNERSEFFKIMDSVLPYIAKPGCMDIISFAYAKYKKSLISVYELQPIIEHCIKVYREEEQK